MSQIIEELKEFAQRLCSDGYPTQVIDRAIIRMEAMEALLLDIHAGLPTEDKGNYEQTSK